MNHIQRVLTGAALAVFCAAAFSCSNAFQDATGASSSGGGGKPTIRENQDPAFTIGSVIVNGSATVKPGGTAQYTATVTGTGTYSAAVTWSVTSSAGPLVGVTGISGGLLTVDGGEALDTVLTVKAVSAADVTKEGILPVTVSDYAISLSGSSDNFTSADFNYTNQSGNAITITVENTGAQPTGTLTAALDASTTTGNYILSPASLSGIPVGQSDTSSLTIYPGTGLDAGTYTAVVKVSGDHGISATVSLDFTVNKANMTGTL